MAPTNANATGVWTAQNKNNAKQGRQLMQALFANNDATPLNGTRSGVVPTTWDVVNQRFTDLLVTVTSGLNMSVAPGWAIAHRSGQGPYPGYLDAAAAIACDTAPASNPRNDLVIMRMYDAAIGGDSPPGGNPCRIELVTGTPNASPVDPMTVNALGVYTGFADGLGGIGIPLARAQVSTSGVITLTRLRRSAGGIGVSRALLEGDSDTGGRPGDMRYTPSTDTLDVKRSDGTYSAFPKGVIARGFVTTQSNGGVGANPTSAMRLDSVSLQSGHMYRIFTNNVTLFGTANDTDSMNIRFKTGGVAAGTGDAELPGARSEVKLVNGGGTAGMVRCDTVYVPGADQVVSLLVTGERNTGSGTVIVYADATNILALTVVHLGVAPTNTAMDL